MKQITLSLLAPEVTREIDELPLHEPGFAHVFLIHEDDPPAIVDPAVAVIQTIDRRVKLIVAPDRRQQILPGPDLGARERMRDEDRLARRRLETPLIPRRIRQIKCALADAVIESGEARDRPLRSSRESNRNWPHAHPNRAASSARAPPWPSPATMATSLSSCLRGGLQIAAGRIDHAHAVFDRHELLPARLPVHFGAAQAGQDQRRPPGDQMRAVQLDGDVRGEPAFAQRRGRELRIRWRRQKVAAHREEELARALRAWP